jgi:uncharacterized protein YyaL (SSP411 family)
MAHESFEHHAVAAILNEHFVAIKVDREERPDVDKVYMAYVQSLTGHGGWPLSAWLTPELKPFYGGTYFPPADRQGRAGFPAILRAIATGWANERDKLVAEADRVLGTLKAHYEDGANRQTPDAQGADATLAEAAGSALERGFQHLYEAFDAANGGFGGAPKFPRASNLSFLFRVAAMQRPPSQVSAEAVRLAAATLRAMARGGIHDHVGGGYHRYSVDEAWFVPHFEKMLYDQAQIAMNCLEAKQATGDERFAWMARDIFDYVRRDLTSPAGGFYTAEDADSATPEAAPSDKGQAQSDKTPAHAEGAFYVWTAAELRTVLGDDGARCPHRATWWRVRAPARHRLSPFSRRISVSRRMAMFRRSSIRTASLAGKTYLPSGVHWPKRRGSSDSRPRRRTTGCCRRWRVCTRCGPSGPGRCSTTRS